MEEPGFCHHPVQLAKADTLQAERSFGWMFSRGNVGCWQRGRWVGSGNSSSVVGLSSAPFSLNHLLAGKIFPHLWCGSRSDAWNLVAWWCPVGFEVELPLSASCIKPCCASTMLPGVCGWLRAREGENTQELEKKSRRVGEMWVIAGCTEFKLLLRWV